MPLAFSRGFLVEDAVGLDGLAVGVGEEGELNALLVGEGGQHFRVVVADGRDLESSRLNVLLVRLQLHQLLLAERSPVRRADEHQRHGAVLEQLAQRTLLAGLVREGEVRGLLADLDPGVFRRSVVGPAGRRRPGRGPARRPPCIKPFAASRLLWLETGVGGMLANPGAAAPSKEKGGRLHAARPVARSCSAGQSSSSVW